MTHPDSQSAPSLVDSYRREALAYDALASTTRSLREGSRLRKIAASYRALAESEAWLVGSPVPARS